MRGSWGLRPRAFFSAALVNSISFRPLGPRARCRKKCVSVCVHVFGCAGFPRYLHERRSSRIAALSVAITSSARSYRMAASSSAGLGGMLGSDPVQGPKMYAAWKRRHADTWFPFFCPLKSLRNPNYSGPSGKEVQFLLGVEWRLACERIRKQHPSNPTLIPVFANEIAEFDVRCWWLGVPPHMGLTIRQHNYERSQTVWP